ncbi:hypothetical protein GUJ93_ZPchr0008g12232 [Zizania palustris]|uniref:Uncharacterized protein n=1 Tax=Zizania palustris TaxID=103762 RepID=A0A8J5VI35_ZIZPA|nr:hypothetical protein GUJ93_ZPchr0008g12232 [Zizania palustris]
MAAKREISSPSLFSLCSWRLHGSGGGGGGAAPAGQGKGNRRCRAPEGLSRRVGFLVLGIMGAPMASQLPTSSRPVVSLSPPTSISSDVKVWNRTRSKCDPLLRPGAKYVDASTVDAATSTGASFLEWVPVSGSKKLAEDGLLVFLTAGKLLPPRSVIVRE